MRDLRQKQAVRAYLDHVDGRTIINACPRFGKIKVALDIVKQKGYKHVWILAPRKDIFKGWQDDIKKFGGPTITGMTTFTSIKKLTDSLHPELIIIDEPHELSANQIKALKPFAKKYPTLGLTGTITEKTRKELYDGLGLDVCFQYSIEQGVNEGILADYHIFIHKVPLSKDLKEKVYTTSKGHRYSEKGYFDMFLKIRNAAEPKQKWFMDIKLINIIQNSYAKKTKTIELIQEHKHNRILVFCGVTAVADSLNIPVYHSKAKEKVIFDDFCKGNSFYLATIKMMQAGITITPINLGIINYMSGNPEDSAQKICRFLGFEYDTPDKEAELHIVCSDEPFELGRLKTGLAFFEQSKITIL